MSVVPDPALVLSVSDLTNGIAQLLRDQFASVWVEGEVSNFSRSGAGHAYLTVKDDRAQLRVVIWRGDLAKIPFEIHDGLQVLLQGDVEVYPARGQYQLIARRALPKGVGPLELAFRQLCQKLEAEGLFRPERKRPIPRFARRVALVTSPRGAAIRDFLEVAGRRWPRLDVVVVPSAVQGDAAPGELAAALQTASRIDGVDVIALVRGGGSIEDLWAFNSERLARSIVASPLPVVCGVGHEIDLTVADLVADLRALTPSEAAELIFPDAAALRSDWDRQTLRLVASARTRTQLCRRAVERVESSLAFKKPRARIEDYARRGDDLERRLAAGAARSLENAGRMLDVRARALEALSPLRVLSRGYSMTTRSDGSVVVDARDVELGDPVRVALARGALECQIVRTEPTEERDG